MATKLQLVTRPGEYSVYGTAERKDRGGKVFVEEMESLEDTKVLASAIEHPFVD